jgi:hypothetical protein
MVGGRDWAGDCWYDLHHLHDYRRMVGSDPANGYLVYLDLLGMIWKILYGVLVVAILAGGCYNDRKVIKDKE